MRCVLGGPNPEIVYTGHKVEAPREDGKGDKAGDDTSLPSEGIAICFAQENPDSDIQWTIDIYAWLPQGRFRLGGIITNTITVDIDPARIVAFASCPGVIGWSLIVGNATAAPASDGDAADIYIQGGKCCGGGSPYGVTLPPGGSTGGNPGGGDGGGTGRQGLVES